MRRPLLDQRNAQVARQEILRMRAEIERLYYLINGQEPENTLSAAEIAAGGTIGFSEGSWVPLYTATDVDHLPSSLSDPPVVGIPSTAMCHVDNNQWLKRDETNTEWIALNSWVEYTGE